ncbi:MAG: class I SAM-dependent methyltransferase [Patescibacteria group bacterium]
MEYNSRRYAFLVRFDAPMFETVKKYLAPKTKERILEVGCNRGFLVKRMQEEEIDAWGVDINPQAIKHGVTENLQIADATDLPFPDASFDKIYSLHTIEHIPNTKKVFQEMERVLKPEGKIVIVYPAELIRGMFALRSAIFVYRKPFLCRKIHVHNFSPKDIKQLTKGSRLEYVKSHFPVLFLPQYLTILKKCDAPTIRVMATSRQNTLHSLQNIARMPAPYHIIGA